MPPVAAPGASPSGPRDPGPAPSPRAHRLRRVVLAATAAAILACSSWHAAAGAHEPDGLDRFLWALGQVESGGRYDAENATTGAYGKYQILPSNWPAWARRYLGDSHAKPTPHNQEVVARGRVTDLFQSLDDWAAVAYWWLTGETDPVSKWPPAATGYVERVLALYGGLAQGPATGASISTSAADRKEVAPATFQDSSAAIDYGGHWGVASHPAYSNGSVRYSGEPGARATLAFVGTSITWFGPVGPTRGKARIVFDGVAVRIVDLHRLAFQPSVALFRRSWKVAGRHTLTIDVLSDPGRGLVAIDRFVVGR